MKSRIAVGVFVALAGTSTFADPAAGSHAGGRSGGGHSSGARVRWARGVERLLPRRFRGRAPFGRSRGSEGFLARLFRRWGLLEGTLVRRLRLLVLRAATATARRPTGAEGRHPRAGYGTGSRYGYGYAIRPRTAMATTGTRVLRRVLPLLRRLLPVLRRVRLPYWGYGGVSVGLYYDNSYPAPTYGYPAEDSYPREPVAEPRSTRRASRGRTRVSPQLSAALDGAPRRRLRLRGRRVPGGALRIGTLRLTPGRHHVEVVRPGFSLADREVDVRLDAPVSSRSISRVRKASSASFPAPEEGAVE